MARTRGMIRTLAVGIALCAAVQAGAAGPCAEESGASGLTLAARTGQVVIDAVADGSAAAQAGLRAGDAITQANAMVLAGCSEWAKAAKDARHDRKALLLLVTRDGADRAVALPATMWGPPPEAPAERAPVAKPSFPAPPPTLPPLPETVNVSVDSVRQDLDRLAPEGQEPTDLGTYRKAVTQVRRAIATLSIRQAAPADALNALRVALRPFEAAEVAWDAFEGDRERERRMRKMPVADEATTPFFEGTAVAAVLDEFPALRATVVEDPKDGIVQTAGQWRPVQARTLLWQVGRTQLKALPAPR